jgi:tetratricopeptide (TPR) repeat protein
MPLRLLLALAVTISAGACSKDPEVEKREFLASAQQHARNGKVPEAIVQYRNAIAVDPKFGEARLELGLLLEKQGDLAAAASELVRAADLLPNNVDAQLGAAPAGSTWRPANTKTAWLAPIKLSRSTGRTSTPWF